MPSDFSADLDAYWQFRQRQSLRHARDRAKAQDLLRRIYAWSRRQKRWGLNAGSWVTDMDCTCWARCPSLHALARQAGGWWMWNDGVVFVAMPRWRSRYFWWQEAERALGARLDAERRLARIIKKPDGAVWGRWHERREARRKAKAA